MQAERLGGSGQCPVSTGEPTVTCHWGKANHRTAHRAKRASSDRSGFFRPEGLEAGEGASTGGEGRSGTISAALALSSRNLSNSAIQTKVQAQVGRDVAPCGLGCLPLLPSGDTLAEDPPNFSSSKYHIALAEL